MFKLEKLELHGDSMLPAGHVQTGHTLTLAHYQDDKKQHIDDVHQIEVGRQLVLTRGLTEWMNTSVIAEILEHGDDYVKFRTQTSIYLLTQEKDDECSC